MGRDTYDCRPADNAGEEMQYDVRATKMIDPKKAPELDALTQDQLDEVAGGCADGKHMNEVGASSAVREVSSQTRLVG